MRFIDKPRSAWLTLNRDCNMRCKWCYAQDTGFHESQSMKLEDAYKAIDIIAELEIESVAILGGEPTIYEHLFEVLEYCKSKNIGSILITNGLRLSDKAYVQKLIDVGIGAIDFAVKGGTRKEYIDVTGSDVFQEIIVALEIVRKMKIEYQIAYIVSDENVGMLYETLNRLQWLKYSQDDSIVINFCDPYFRQGKIYAIEEPIRILNTFMEQAEISMKENIKFSLFCPAPLCFLKKEFIEKLIKNGSISSVCYVHDRSGIVFDTNMNLLACNILFNYPLGIFGKDYSDATTLLKYLGSDKVVGWYEELLKVPGDECVTCNDFSVCAGGCVLQWFKYDFRTLKNLCKESVTLL